MRIFSICKKHLLKQKYALAAYFCISIMSIGITIASPYILGDFIDSLITGAGINFIVRFCIIFGGLNLLGVAIGYISSMLHLRLQNKIGYSFNRAVLQHVIAASLTFSSKQDPAYLSNRVTQDTNTLVGFCISVVTSTVTNVVKLALPLVLLLRLHAQITLVMLIFMLAYFVLYFVCKKMLYSAGLRLRESWAHFAAKLLEPLYHVKLIKVNAIMPKLMKRTDDAYTEYETAAKSNQQVNYLYTGLDGIVSTIAQIVLFVLGGMQLLAGNFTIGMFTMFTAYFNLMLASMRYFYGLGASYQTAMASYDRVQEILAQPAEEYGTDLLDGIHTISLNNISFGYNDTNVISHYSKEFVRGSAYCIAGANGAGKSTLVSLLMGLYANETTGDVLYNGKNIRSLEMHSIRKAHIGFAAQEPMLIHGTIRQNLFLDEPIDELHLNKCINALNMREFINKYALDDITVDSNNLSGGEKQKIALLAVLCKNPDVMIFDEPTSAMDAQSAAMFMHYLMGIKSDKMIIVISHDEAVIKQCDIRLDIKI